MPRKTHRVDTHLVGKRIRYLVSITLRLKLYSQANSVSYFPTIKDINVAGKRLLIRVDFNVPIEDGQVASDRRITAALPTIRYALKQNSKIVLMTHLGRPGGEADPSLSLKPVAERLEKLLDGPSIRLVENWTESEDRAQAEGEIILLENLRFHAGEKESEAVFCGILASWGDIYVNDAFAACHRRHASTHGVAKLFNEEDRVIGLLVDRELRSINEVLGSAERPLVVALGGVKVSGKIGVVDQLLETAEYICIGGAMAFTFLKADGRNVGNSKVEYDALGLAKQLLTRAGERIILPSDHVIADQPDGDAKVERADGGIPGGWYGLDIGPKTIGAFTKLVREAGTVIWNGPMGKFEDESFFHGTQAMVHALCETNARTLIGGGESILALEQFGDVDAIDHVSTGGGAFLTYLKARELPALEMIPQRQGEHVS